MVCRTHSKTPAWFCVDEDVAVCEDCQNPTQHSGHQVIRLEEAVKSFKHNVDSELKESREKLGKYHEAQTTYRKMVQHTKDQLAAVERRMKAEFEELHRFLRDEEEARLAALREEEEQKGKILHQELQILQDQIQSLTDSVHHVEEELRKDDVTFLKDYKNTKSRAQRLLQDPHLVSGALIDEAKHLGNLKFKVWEKMLDIVHFNPVVLDPNTASGQLQLSEDLTRVRYTNDLVELPDNPERFGMYSEALGSEGFTSGTHSWDVLVKDRIHWAVGVARRSVERKRDTSFSAEHGLWTVRKNESKYTASGKTLNLKVQPETIRVHLDYERGVVSFYNPVDSSHIYTYRVNFTDTAFPYFYTGTDPSDLQIQPSRVCVAVSP
ncbi:tripartite motif-containing protein 35-like [Denticeps clupeoides]|nr:tripartite motif-containing protein 35-like [Denticeps clupeoides]